MTELKACCEVCGCTKSATHTILASTDEGMIPKWVCNGHALDAIRWSALDLDDPDITSVCWQGESWSSIDGVYYVIPALPLVKDHTSLPAGNVDPLSPPRVDPLPAARGDGI